MPWRVYVASDAWGSMDKTSVHHSSSIVNFYRACSRQGTLTISANPVMLHTGSHPIILARTRRVTIYGRQLRAGAEVVVLARSRAKFSKFLSLLVEKKLPTDGLHFIAVDLSSADDIRRAATEANDWAGGCADILVNNGRCIIHVFPGFIPLFVSWAPL